MNVWKFVGAQVIQNVTNAFLQCIHFKHSFCCVVGKIFILTTMVAGWKIWPLHFFFSFLFISCAYRIFKMRYTLKQGAPHTSTSFAREKRKARTKKRVNKTTKRFPFHSQPSSFDMCQPKRMCVFALHTAGIWEKDRIGCACTHISYSHVESTYTYRVWELTYSSLFSVASVMFTTFCRHTLHCASVTFFPHSLCVFFPALFYFYLVLVLFLLFYLLFWMCAGFFYFCLVVPSSFQLYLYLYLSALFY